jgi:integrase
MHPEEFLTLDEWHSLLAAAPTPRDAALLWLMAGCGLRVSEVAALKVEHWLAQEDTCTSWKGRVVNSAPPYYPGRS